MEEFLVPGELIEKAPDQKPPDTFEKTFKPKGAIAFFVLLVLLGLFIWFSIYYLMLSRT